MEIPIYQEGRSVELRIFFCTMEKAATAGIKKAQDESLTGDQDASTGEGEELKKVPAVEKPEKEEGNKTDVTPVHQRRERNTSSSTPRAPSRSTRSSNNPEFVAKQRHFLQKVNQGVFYQSSEEESDYASTNGQSHSTSKRKRSVSGGPGHSEASTVVKNTSSADPGSGSSGSHASSPVATPGSKGSTVVKKRKHDIEELTRDIYCWVCHREMGTSSGGSTLSCEVCPRVYHARCCHSMDPGSPHPNSPSSSSTSGNSPAPSNKGWACPECVKIVRAETMGTRSRAMQLISLDQLGLLLKFVLTRVRAVTGAEPFYGAVDLIQFPRYREFVANPMDLGLMDRNIRRRTYGSTEAFFADMKWLVHNSIIFNTQHSKLTSIARSMLKTCRQELMEIENCPDCYCNAHTRKDNWFIDVCRRPHILVWAKLKGFPHWPAKAMRVNKESCVDVRFFGQHDRAWVPARDCYLYSKEMPAPPKNRKKNNFDGCIMEVEDHIKKLKEKYGVFVYAPLRTIYDPSQDEEILMKMLPKYQPVNFDSPTSFSRENLQEDQISRESPSMSTGTEEESDRDQSVDGDSTSHKRRDFENTFDDSMEIPSGSDAGSQSKENSARSAQSLGKGEKAKEEPATESEASKDETLAVDSKSDAETQDKKEITEGKEEGKKMETVEKEEVSDTQMEETEKKSKAREEDTEEIAKESPALEDEGVKDEKMDDEEAKKESVSVDAEEKSRDGDSEGMAVVTTTGKNEEKEEKMEERESMVESTQLQDGNKTKPSLPVSVEENAKETERIEIDGKEAAGVAVTEISDEAKGKGRNDEERADESNCDVISENSLKVASDKNKEISELPNEVNRDQEARTEDVEESSVGENSVTKGPSETSGERKVDVQTKVPGGEDREESAASTPDVEEKPKSDTNDTPVAETMSKTSCAQLKKDANDAVAGKVKTDSGEFVNDDSEDEKLAALIDHKIVPEIPKIIKTAGTEDDSVKITPPTDSAKKDKPTDSGTPEKSCDKPENVALDREGEESRAKLFQSLRLVNIETLHKQDAKELLAKKGGVELEKVKKDSPSGVVGNQLDVTSKIDVNKLRESLMTKCAGSSVISSDLNPSENAASRSNVNSPSKLSTKLKISESSSDDVESKSMGESMDVDSEDVTNDTPAASSVIPTSPGSNKGDVGSQLRVLGKLQQRLSFIKETASDSEESALEKEDENTAEDADSVTGDASGTSNSDEEEPASIKDKNSEAEKRGDPAALSIEQDANSFVDVAVKEDNSCDGDSSTRPLTEKEKKSVEHSDDVEEKGELLSGSNVLGDEESTSIKIKGSSKDEKVESVELDSDEECSRDSAPKVSDNETEKPTKSVECNKEVNLAKSKKPLKGKASEVTDPDRASPITSKRPKLLEDNDSVKSRASPLKGKSEEVVEEEVLNREVLKESNMVVVQKTVKTRRLDDETSGTGSAPKRARKGIAQKSSVVDRSESPGQDEVFPSMFLDPSVTITVLQESEKENGVNKDQSSSSSSVEELRTSVNLSNDVSLTMVQGTGALEGLAVVQDGAMSRSSESQDVDILGQNAQNSLVAPQFRPRARKSFPRPSPRAFTRSPHTPSQSPNMEVRRLSASSSRESSPVNISGSPSLLKTAPANSMASMPAVAMRGASGQAPVPMMPMNSFPSPAFTSPSTSQGLVRTVVSPVMPSSSLLMSQSNCISPRLPNLSPRPPTFPFSGHHSLFTPSEAGPVSAEFNKHAQKLSCYMRQAIEDILGDLTKMGNTEATIKSLRLEVEKLRWEHAQEIAELKHNHELVLSEIKNAVEKEKMRLANDVRRQCEAEKMRAVEETKRKQWCANCSKEALFYCCWNTSYCDYPCQQTHWPRHMASCAQNNGMPESGGGDSGAGSNRKDSGNAGHRGPAPPPPFHQQGPSETPPPLGAASEPQNMGGESSLSVVPQESVSTHLSQTSPYGGSMTTQSIPVSSPQGHQQDSSPDPPQQQLITTSLPPLLTQPHFSSPPLTSSGNEQSPVSQKASKAAPSPAQPNKPENMPTNDQTLNACSPQALVPLPLPNGPQQQDQALVIPVSKPNRSRKGHPQRARSNSNPTRNAYLQPPHFIRQPTNYNNQPLNVHIPEMSPKCLENQPFLPHSFPPMSKGLMLQTEKPQVIPSNSCPPSPYLVPPSNYHEVPRVKIPLGSGGGPKFTSGISITPIPMVGPNLSHSSSPSNDASVLEARNYSSPSIMYKRNSEGNLAEVLKDTTHLKGLGSREQIPGQKQVQPKHDRNTQKRGSAPPSQSPKSCIEDIHGRGNAHPQLLQSDGTFFGSKGSQLNPSQAPENLAALPPNFYPQTTMSHCGPMSSVAQLNHVAGNILSSNSKSAPPSAINYFRPPYKPNGIPNFPGLYGNQDGPMSRNLQNEIIPQNPAEVGLMSPNYPMRAQEAGPRHPMTDIPMAKFDSGMPKNYARLPNPVDHLPNFNATFLNQNARPEIHPQPAPSPQANGQHTPPRNSKGSRKCTKKNAEQGQGESSRSRPPTPYDVPGMYKFRPESPASFCNQINCSPASCSRGNPHHHGNRPNYPENNFLLPGNPFPLSRYSAPGHGSHGSHPRLPATSQPNHNSFNTPRSPCMAILSATSIIMPPPPPNPPPPNFVFPPPPFDMQMLVRQHQLHRHQMANGVNMFSETLKNPTDRARKL
ncbi:uncharacterized protein LOC124161233 isoform X2 [Ischnura elegans]|uniref:uncharacterized protein LOC124161233 isoform X2 n=1 Tax=Ischnura elegans TaxID=197161 RepID=UPI001ED8A611|nr:uncharacterized protein LOC124161233 isoform X2 [Ischnura elegans]